MEDNSIDEKSVIISTVVRKLKDSGLPIDNISDISHSILEVAYDRYDEDRWKVKQKLFSIVYEDII
jgi:GH35 family endo-1,4-beta-xylanase